MTKNLYEQPQTTSYQFESVRQTANFDSNNYEYSQEIENYQQEGEYQVDYDPEILADIQRLKGWMNRLTFLKFSNFQDLYLNLYFLLLPKSHYSSHMLSDPTLS